MPEIQTQQLVLSEELKSFFTEQLATERKQWDKRIEDLGPKFDDMVTKAAYTEVVKRLDMLQALLGKAEPDTTNGEHKSFARSFFESENLKEFQKRAKGINGFAYQYEGGIFDGHSMFSKDISALGAESAAILSAQRINDVKFVGVRALRVRDLIPSFTTSEAAITFIKENSFTNAAYPQVEAAAKGHTALTFTAAQVLVKTIAHYIKASRQALADWAQLQQAIDFKLLVGLKDAEDFELLRGDGTGEHLTGLLVAAAAFNKTVESGYTMIDEISLALEQLEDNNRRGTGIVLRPSDWRAITRLRTNEGGTNQGPYMLGGPAGDTEPRLWGLPVAVSNAVPPDNFLVGDFVGGCALYDREQSRIDVSTENEDDFIKNMVTIRAEERLAFPIFRDDYFVRGIFTTN